MGKIDLVPDDQRWSVVSLTDFFPNFNVERVFEPLKVTFK